MYVCVWLHVLSPFEWQWRTILPHDSQVIQHDPQITIAPQKTGPITSKPTMFLAEQLTVVLNRGQCNTIT